MYYLFQKDEEKDKGNGLVCLHSRILGSFAALTSLAAFQCRQREVARVAGVKLKRKALEADKKRVAGDAVKVQTVQQKLDDLQQKDDDEHAAYLAALGALTATT